MNWRIIVQLSLFGLLMAGLTIRVIPSNIEPFFWVPILAFSGFQVGRRAPSRPFVHGVLVGLANCVWVTSAHIIFLATYLQNHAQEAEMMASPSMSPRMMMLITGLGIGLISGGVIGVLGLLTKKLLAR